MGGGGSGGGVRNRKLDSFRSDSPGRSFPPLTFTLARRLMEYPPPPPLQVGLENSLTVLQKAFAAESKAFGAQAFGQMNVWHSSWILLLNRHTDGDKQAHRHQQRWNRTAEESKSRRAKQKKAAKPSLNMSLSSSSHGSCKEKQRITPVVSTRRQKRHPNVCRVRRFTRLGSWTRFTSVSSHQPKPPSGFCAANNATSGRSGSWRTPCRDRLRSQTKWARRALQTTVMTVKR